MPWDPTKFHCPCGVSFDVYVDFMKHLEEAHPAPFFFKCIFCLPHIQSFYLLDDFLKHLEEHVQQWTPQQENQATALPPAMKTMNLVESHPTPCHQTKNQMVPPPQFNQQQFHDCDVKQRHHDITALLGGKRYLKKARFYICEIPSCHRKTHKPMSHIVSHLMKDGQKPFYCMLCGNGFMTRGGTQHHVKFIHHDIRIPQIEAVRDRRFVIKKEIKEMVKRCFPSAFVNARLPTLLDLLALTYGAHGVDLLDMPPVTPVI